MEQPGKSTHELLIRRPPALVSTGMYNRKEKAMTVRLTNVSTRSASCPAHYSVLLWLPHVVLPRNDGYVILNATNYHDWQVLAYGNAMGGRLFKKEEQ